jgi:hypothetical protein
MLSMRNNESLNTRTSMPDCRRLNST